MATSGARGTNRRCEGTSAQGDREIGTLRPMETESRATLIESPDLRRVALGPWGSLVYPWWFGTTRLRFKSGRTHLTSGSKPISIPPSIADRWFESALRRDEAPSTRTCERTQRLTGGTGIWHEAPRLPR